MNFFSNFCSSFIIIIKFPGIWDFNWLLKDLIRFLVNSNTSFLIIICRGYFIKKSIAKLMTNVFNYKTAFRLAAQWLNNKLLENPIKKKNWRQSFINNWVNHCYWFLNSFHKIVLIIWKALIRNFMKTSFCELL